MRTLLFPRQRRALDVLTALMTVAFLDIRLTSGGAGAAFEVEGLDTAERVRMIANMFHNVPGQMQIAANGQMSYQPIVDLLWSENHEHNGGAAGRWLDGAVRAWNLDRSSPVFDAWVA